MTKDEIIQQLLQQINTLTDTVDAQTLLIAQLNQTIQELKEQLNKNSKNSSKPPSSDGLKKPAPKSLRKSSGKKAGGQNGHQGTHLAVITAPDETVKHMPFTCEGCPHYQMCKGTACIAEKRHVIDAVVAKYTAKAPEYDFVTEDGITNTVWVVDDENDINALTAAFEKIPCLYIADGHHRAASAVKVGLK